MESSPPPRPANLNDPEMLRLLTESLRANGTGRIHLRGDSMLPTLRDGWKLHVRSVPAGEMKVGEIGIFLQGGLLTIHRLIWKLVDGGVEKYIFQGDNNPHRETVAPEAILGRVEAAEGAWSRRGLPESLPVGNDSRAFFYRSAYGVHSLLTRLIPGVAPPGAEGGGGSLPYRFLRACFRFVEPVFAPRPRR